jgi:hypothetical protein
VLLQISAAADPKMAYEVTLKWLPDGKVVHSAVTPIPARTASSFSPTPQAVPNEAMNNGAKLDVGQMSLAYTPGAPCEYDILAFVRLSCKNRFSRVIRYPL